INKIDLKNSQTEISDSIRNRLQLEICEISCLTKFGIENLLKMISAKIKDEKISDDFVLLEERHRYHLLKIAECMEKAAKLLGENTPAEIYIKEIDYAIAEIGQINGRVDTEEILGRIFSKFCVGK
ncbi:MAG: tRNA uridine-5-carboxymethylaminomethyl(34) synthesis GTPase MnmE, partial [Leptospira sp.]|nr:tRNA uridine-5-carboxymethylaminomethyl(34) synthesis GTPase MnmE [Leptospira sp.]